MQENRIYSVVLFSRNRQAIQDKYCIRGAEWGVGDCSADGMSPEDREKFIAMLEQKAGVEWTQLLSHIDNALSFQICRSGKSTCILHMDDELISRDSCPTWTCFVCTLDKVLTWFFFFNIVKYSLVYPALPYQTYLKCYNAFSSWNCRYFR